MIGFHKPKLSLNRFNPVQQTTSIQVAPLDREPVWVVETEAEAKRLLNLLYAQPLVAVDTETTGLNYMKDRVVVWSMSWGNRVFLHGSVIPVIKPWLEDSSKAKVFHNRKYDCHIFLNHGVDVQGPCYDTMIMHWLLDENLRHGLKELVTTILGKSRESYKSLFGKIPLDLILNQDLDAILKHFSGKMRRDQVKDGLTWVPNKDYKALFLNATDDAAKAMSRFETLKEKLITYATDDALDTFNLFNVLKEKMVSQSVSSDKNLWDYYAAVEEPFTRVLQFTERNGFCIDTEFLEEIGTLIDKDIQKAEFAFYKAARKQIDMNSTKQLIKLFFHELKYPVVKTTPGKYCTACLKDATKATYFKCKEHGSTYLQPKPSTDDEVLEKLVSKGKKKYALAGIMQDYRGLAKLQSTYVKGIMDSIGDDGRCRTSLHQHGTLTGRLSSGDKRNGYPNLQNIPVLSKDKFGLRHTFVPPPGYGLIVLDYSQIELRLLAHFSGDKAMLDTYLNNGDIHTTTAKRIWKVDESHVEWDQYRKNAKGINFGIIYGMGPWKLAKKIDVSEAEADEYIINYFKGYPGVEAFIKKTHYECRQQGYVKTILGRRRRVLEIMSDDPKVYGDGKRQAVNSIIQGSAADIVKKIMIKVSEKNNPVVAAYGAKMLLQVHDELIFECPLSTIEEATEYIREQMEHPFDRPLRVPLKVEGSWGMSWGESK